METTFYKDKEEARKHGIPTHDDGEIVEDYYWHLRMKRRVRVFWIYIKENYL